ncbi:MAG TPA: excinuclease ABC subunit UvrC [Candidatus Woesearchaeota archaeon]|nr:excinuclease ABC subunit UvrC [Candidatus Woesearchaeota archaeon]
MAFKIKDIDLVQSPGCYIFKDSGGKIIYIGKAKNLKKRVLSYFNKRIEDVKTQRLVSEISDIEFFVTKTELDALVLEASLIKRYKPKYNIDLKDSKAYGYILISDERFARILVARNKKVRGRVFGPFPNGRMRNEIIEILIKAFKIRTCKKLPKKPCVRYQMGLCYAPCIGKISKEEYESNIENVIMFLKGKNSELIKKLKDDMYLVSEKLDFERAMIIKNQIEALRYLTLRQEIDDSSYSKEDVINYIEFLDKDNFEKKVMIVVFDIRDGIIRGKSDFTIDFEKNFLDEFLVAYYDSSEKIPNKIVLPKELEDLSIKDYIEGIANRKILFIVPKSGKKKSLLDLARRNIEIKLKGYEKVRPEIVDKLRLPNEGRIIECFDISHFAGSEMVGSMVRFFDGEPDKREYRRFMIKTVEGIDDFRAIYEIVKRRYKRLLTENKKMPDLVLIDGGRIQLDFALKALDELGVKIPCVSIAKKFEEIYVPFRKQPLRFDIKSDFMRLFIRIRDEAHRFGITYNRLLRSKKVRASFLKKPFP